VQNAGVFSGLFHMNAGCCSPPEPAQVALREKVLLLTGHCQIQLSHSILRPLHHISLHPSPCPPQLTPSFALSTTSHSILRPLHHISLHPSPSPPHLTPSFALSTTQISRWRALSAKHGVSIEAVAVAFAALPSAVDKLVLGMKTKEEVLCMRGCV
jgi:hypothetical protein